MRPKIAAGMAEQLEKYKDLINGSRKNMAFLRELSGLTYDEIAHLSGWTIEEIQAQEEGKIRPDLRIISPVVLIYYMFIYDKVPEWINEKLFFYRHKNNIVS